MSIMATHNLPVAQWLPAPPVTHATCTGVDVLQLSCLPGPQPQADAVLAGCVWCFRAAFVRVLGREREKGRGPRWFLSPAIMRERNRQARK